MSPYPINTLSEKLLHNSNYVSLLELSVDVSYDSDLDKVTKIITDAINKHADARDFKKPLVGILGFGDSSVDIEIRVWVDSIKFNAARFSLNKVIRDVLKDAEISIPFPQREVHLLKLH